MLVKNKNDLNVLHLIWDFFLSSSMWTLSLGFTFGRLADLEVGGGNCILETSGSVNTLIISSC